MRLAKTNPSRVAVVRDGGATLGAIVGLIVSGCAEPRASIGRCGPSCFEPGTASSDAVSTVDDASESRSRTADPGATGDVELTREATGQAASHASVTSDVTAHGSGADAGQPSEFDRTLAAVDERMDYGYDDDPVLHALSRAAGRAGTAQCLCYGDEEDLQFLAGCALDEARNEAGGIPIDSAEAMACVIEFVGRAEVDAYAACAIVVLEEKRECYAGRRNSGECVTCRRGFGECPHRDAIDSVSQECWLSDLENRVPARRIRGVDAGR